MRSGNPTQALDHLGQAFRLSYSSNHPVLTGQILLSMGQTYYRLEQSDRAADCFRTALKMDSTQCAEVRISAHSALARLAEQRGSTKEAIDHYQEAISAAQESGDSATQAALLNDIADLQMKAGRAKEALATYTRALDLAHSANCPDVEVNAHIGAASAFEQLQQRENMAHQCEHALMAMRHINNRL